GSTKRTVTASPWRERSTSEYCWRLSNRSAVIVSSRRKKIWPAPLNEAAPARLLPSSPPEGFLGLVHDVAPGQADVVKFAGAPLRQLLAGAIALPPDVDGLAEVGQNARNMMICHRFMGQSGHFQLLKLSLHANICLP